MIVFFSLVFISLWFAVSFDTKLFLSLGVYITLFF